MDITETIDQIAREVEDDLKSVHHAKDVEALRVKYLGKKGSVQGLMSLLKGATPEERPAVGKAINDLKVAISEKIDKLHAHLTHQELTMRLADEKTDVTLPGRRRPLGRRHVILQMLDEATEILTDMGFTVQYAPEIETDYYNFEGLNFPKDHPARDMQDTYYITHDLLLRTQTSNVQVRVMEGCTPPIRIIAPGKCYRNEDVSARSHVVFHQIDGLYIDTDVTFADLLATLEQFFSRLFYSDIKIRYRPSYFPFVEPGMEVDMSCLSCKGSGCSLCKKTGWLEVCGAGMVHPEVLKNGGIDPETHTGFAWAFGIERLALLRYQIPDIRLFLENNLNFLNQF